MRARELRPAVVLLALVASAAHVSAQDVTELLGAGRYEDAVALLADVGPETAHVGAEMLYERAYGTDFENGDYENAIRGFVAGKRIPHLSERQLQRFEFWHAVALVNTVRRDREGPADLTTDEALAMLGEAHELLVVSRAYATGINQVSMSVNVARLIDEVAAGR